jgi:hypothetical protein
MEVKENFSLIKEKHLLIRQLNNKYISQEEYASKVFDLDAKIKSNTLQSLKDSEDLLKEKVIEVKVENLEDGNMKRKIASIMIDILKMSNLDNDTIKGICRQGYKIMRGN